MKRRGGHVALLVISLGVAPASVQAITTPQIITDTTSAALACMQWMPVGVCFWLQCSAYSCSVNTSLKVGHYNPDLVVSAYNELGGNPWQEIRAILGSLQTSAANGLLGALTSLPIESAGNRTEGTTRRDHKNLIFRETDAIGHPINALSGIAAGYGLSCQSQATAFLPYFQSGVDALAWRDSALEAFYPASVIPGLREIGSWPLQTWGGVFPRTGWTIQAEEPKAAAINAERAGDIVTRTAQPHIYLPLSGPAGVDQRVWPPDPLVEGDARTGTWQMLAPIVDSSCAVFGTNDLTDANSWSAGRVEVEGDYTWTLWRPYSCCRRRGQTFLFSVDWMVYPP